VYKVCEVKGRNDKAVKSWQMYKKNGNRYTAYRISKFLTRRSMPPPSTLIRPEYKRGVKVIDLR
jgi:hypothetical protein